MKDYFLLLDLVPSIRIHLLHELLCLGLEKSETPKPDFLIKAGSHSHVFIAKNCLKTAVSEKKNSNDHSGVSAHEQTLILQ